MNDCREVWCNWQDGIFVPCTDMKKAIEKGEYYGVHYRQTKKRIGNNCFRTITKCPFCNSSLRDEEKINNEYKTLRKFQIRNTDNNGCGSFYYVIVPFDIGLEDIKNVILDKMTDEKEKEDSINFGLFFRKNRFDHNRRMKVVELDLRTMGTKRKGLKGYVYSDWVKLKGINILTSKKFEREYSSFGMEWSE